MKKLLLSLLTACTLQNIYSIQHTKVVEELLTRKKAVEELLAKYDNIVEGGKPIIYTGHNVNAIINDYGDTELIAAVRCGDTKNVRLLLIGVGADVNAKDDIGWTALMIAVWLGNTEIAQLLIAKGTDVDAKDNNGDTALIKAAQCGETELVRLLINFGANVHVCSNGGCSALDVATRFCHTEIEELLLEAGAFRIYKI